MEGILKFTLSIKLGNESMQDPADIAEALRNVADSLDHGQHLDDLVGAPIMDLNGNKVGDWDIWP